jgi:hypothetical protein
LMSRLMDCSFGHGEFAVDVHCASSKVRNSIIFSCKWNYSTIRRGALRNNRLRDGYSLIRGCHWRLKIN